MKKLALLLIGATCLVSCELMDILKDFTNEDDGYLEETPGEVVDENGDGIPDGEGFVQIESHLEFLSMDIKGSKSLYVTGDTHSGIRTERDSLFSIDADGKKSPVFTDFVHRKISTDSKGVSTETLDTIRLSVVPTYMHNLNDKYIMMRMEGTNSIIYDENGSQNPGEAWNTSWPIEYKYYISRRYESMETEMYMILVRVSDGKMFYVSDMMYHEYFPFYYCKNESGYIPEIMPGRPATTSYLAENSDIYLNKDGRAAVIKSNKDGVEIKKLNPEGIELFNVRPLNNGTVFAKTTWDEWENGYCFLYENGGMEFFDKTFDTNLIWNKDDNYMGYRLLMNDGEMMALRVTGKKDTRIDEYGTEHETYKLKAELCEYIVGTSYGSCEFGRTLASYEWVDFGYPTTGLEYKGKPLTIAKSGSKLLICNLFIWDGKSDKLEVIDENTYTQMVQEMEESYNGELWKITVENNGDVTATRFDMETLTPVSNVYRISDTVGGFRLTEHSIDMNSGIVTLTGLSLADGTKIVVTLNFITGEITTGGNSEYSGIVSLVTID